MFLDDLSERGVAVDRSIRPSALTLSSDEKELADPHAYPVKAVLEHLRTADNEKNTETVYAKFVIGADGKRMVFIATYLRLTEL
jgi:phenol 2-monooxygenase (NADPH)